MIEMVDVAGIVRSFKESSSADLLVILEKGLRLSVEGLVQAAAAYVELESRKEAPKIEAKFAKMLRRIASGEVLPELVVELVSEPLLLRRACKLSLETQRSLLLHPDRLSDLRRAQPRIVNSSNSNCDNDEMGAVDHFSFAGRCSPRDLAEAVVDAILRGSDPKLTWEFVQSDRRLRKLNARLEAV